ncbi:methylated-DNA--[protein]-cysteine S-methyltransferase [Actinokineospora sp. UTMC 2448]|uniref:methylated-DNA--[protein]-cysteine S-methyltransferase n=1 Tax=Actinokineospora sp. UTMC 2448 TaxID=2268449 RepID=UPI0021643B42|nr:methylated-DNA--[protein]-cysteine S-methyltransferase [Actinokineospora sp. UTMC 2448]UVS81448.1 Methylated-DNA--protein-cysteine methyltransferase [Actinokineospora sp. UTMC 2448]
MTTEDPFAFGDLTEEPPRSLVDLVYASWVAVPGPLGEVFLAFTRQGVEYARPAAALPDGDAGFRAAYRARFGRPLRRADAPPAGVLAALSGRPSRALRLHLPGLSDFERAVLAATRRIPAGQTRPYNWVAAQIGRPRAVRAVGTALGNNPVPLLVPCHRVTKATGEPGGYVFGPAMKERLLRAERVNLDEVGDLARHRVFFIGSDTTRIVCYPTCANARRITERHRRGFRTVEEARAHGYRPCKHCAPAAAAPA